MKIVMLSEDIVSEIIDDTSELVSLAEQHRQQAIYVLAEHIIANCTAEK